MPDDMSLAKKVIEKYSKESDDMSLAKKVIEKYSPSVSAKSLNASVTGETTSEQEPSSLTFETYKENKSLFKRAVDIGMRPLYATVAAGKEVVSQIKGEKEPSITEIGKAGVEGLMGERKNTYHSLLLDLGLPNNIATKIAGWSLDIAGDLSTYIGIGILTKAGKAAQKIGKLGLTLAEQAKSGQRALIGLEGISDITLTTGKLPGTQALFSVVDNAGRVVREVPILKEFSKAFSVKTGNLVLDEIANEKIVREKYLLNFTLDTAEKIKKQSLQLFKSANREGKGAKETTMRVLNTIEKDYDKIPQMLQSANDYERNVAEVAKTLKTNWENVLENEVIVGTSKLGSGREKEMIELKNKLNKLVGDKRQAIIMGYNGEIKTLNEELESLIKQKENVIDTKEPLKRIVDLITRKTKRLETIGDNIKKAVKSDFPEVGGSVRGKIEALENAPKFGYLPRVWSDELTEFLDTKKKILPYDAFNKLKLTLKNMKQRETGMLSLEEWNTLVRENGLEKYGIGAGNVQEFFSTNPAKLVIDRGLRSAMTVSNAEFLNNLKTNFGKPEMYKNVDDVAIEGYEGLKGWVFNAADADDIERTIKNFTDSTRTDGLNNTLLKPLTQLWKQYATLPYPSFHFRNLMGEVWNAAYDNILNPVTYGQTSVMLFSKTPQKMGIKIPDGKVYYGDELIEIMKKQNLWNRGFVSHEQLENAFETLNKSGWDALNPLSRNFIIFQAGRKVSSYVENWTRMTHLAEKLKQGFNVEEAVKATKIFHNSYENITSFERTLFGNFVPFWSWTKFNLPLQVEQTIKMPGRTVLPVEKAISAIQEGNILTEEDQKYLPKWLKDTWAVRVGTTDAKYFPLEGWLPIGDIAKLFSPSAEKITELPEMGMTELIQSVSPILKTPIEIAQNYSAYKQGEIERYPGQVEKFLFMRGENRLPIKAVYYLRSWRILNEIDRLISEETPIGDKLLRFFTGIKLYPVDIQKAKMQYYNQAQRELGELGGAIQDASMHGDMDEMKYVEGLLQKRVKKIR